ncbi:MAG: carbon-nitrogen hydrolase family protein [Chloroflexi bacterium]|nr:MAG: carbon-nitrogen hydrolase family protein [Chloroflexota bacterium]
MSDISQSFSIVVAQFPICLDIEKNLQSMLAIIAHTKKNDIVLFPEGALSGYDDDPGFLKHIRPQAVDKAMLVLQKEVTDRKIHLIFGSCLRENGQWFNAGLYFSHNSSPFIYYKVNLATHERGHFQSGNHLPVFTINSGSRTITAGMQLCREIRFPEQWQQLARSGAELFFYLTNAVSDARALPVWRSHLVSRAAENQRFVIAANNAHENQMCPTMIINPSGNIVAEITSKDIQILRKTIDLSEISNWYLDQARTDVVKTTSQTYQK